jgi:protoporphyrinogen oxidase
MRLIIIGAWLAGLTCAQVLRKVRPAENDLTLFGERAMGKVPR